ncbi:hypothetical protein Tco_1263061 [Tanacetum coccineum]
MVSTMTTRNAGRCTAARRAKEVVEVAKKVTEVAKEVVEMAKKVIRIVKEVVKVGNHVNNQGNNRNQDDNVINDNNQGGAIVYTRWIEKIESVQDMSGCEENQKVKYTAGSFIGNALTWWNSQVQTRDREAAVGMT